MGPLHFILSSPQFHKGLIAGLVAAAAVVAGSTLAERRLLPLAGVAFALATYVALAGSGAVAQIYRVPATLLAGATIAWVLGELGRRVGTSAWLLAIALTPSAIVTAGALIGVAPWVRIATAAFCAIGGACVADFDRRRARLGLAPLLWLITVGAVYSTVPDTEAARALVGVAIPIALLGWPKLYAKFGAGGAGASVCVLGWTIGQSGAARPGSVVGAMGALGLFVIEPLVLRLRTAPGEHAPRRALKPVPTIVTQLAIALAAARWAGLAHGAGTASIRLLIMLPFALLLTLWIDAAPAPGSPRTPPARPHSAHRRQ